MNKLNLLLMPSVYKLEICELEEAGKDLHIIKLANQ